MSERQRLVERCAGCGLAIDGGTAGCQAIIDELLARDFSDVSYFRVHRMVVDVYSLQHPDRYCASGKSLAAHLTGLGVLLERGGSRAVGVEALRRWLNSNARIERPEIPSYRGRLTVADVRRTTDPQAYAEAVERWARSTWEAYAALQPLARRWIAEALDPPG